MKQTQICCFPEGTSHLKMLLCMTFGLLFKPFRQDLKETFIDSGVMSAIKEWLSPLPDRSLPALKIREELLKILQEVWTWLFTFDVELVHSFTVMCFREMWGDKWTAALPMGCAVKHARKQPAQQVSLCQKIQMIWPCLPVSGLYPNLNEELLAVHPWIFFPCGPFSFLFC